MVRNSHLPKRAARISTAFISFLYFFFLFFPLGDFCFLRGGFAQTELGS